MKRIVPTVIALVGVLAACDGFKEAMTAHVDVAARAGSQELTVTKLAELLGTSKAPLNTNAARAVADVWIDYQLLGRAAARGDSLNDPKDVSEAMWAEVSDLRAKKFYDVVSKSWGEPDSATEAAYNQGELLAARHILFVVPAQGLSTAAQDSIRRKAESVRARVTAANFATLARQNSQDPGSAQNGGSLGVFPRGMMVPEFEQALIALTPGEISPLVRSQFGWHIIQRMPYAEAREDFARVYRDTYAQRAERKYLEDLEKTGKVEIKANAAEVAKKVATDIDAHRADETVIATSTAGDFTAAELARWIRAFPPQSNIRGQIASAPDSVIPMFLKSVVRNELVLKAADSAKVQLDSAETAAVADRFSRYVTMSWSQLGVDPKTLADSGSTAQDRERFAAARIDRYVDDLLAERVRYVDIPEPLRTVLREKYDSKVSAAGLDRAVERATRVRATLDSTRALQQPPSQVPVPPAMQPPQGQGGARPQQPTPAPQSRP